MNDTRRILIEGDIVAFRRLLPPGTKTPQVEIGLHMARTASQAVPFKLRAYSHRWLLERNYPSQLPNELKPKAEQVPQVITEGVGVSVRASCPEYKPVAIAVRESMELIVNDTYADYRSPDPLKLRRNMMEARKITLRKLLG